jgi:hypothetical protein
MKRKQKKSLYIPLLLLIAVGLGIGYAVLSEQLSINNTVHYGAIAWDVGFSEAVDGGGSITSTSSLSSDKKTVTVTCNVGTSTASETCVAKVKVANTSTFAVEVSENPTITFEDDYISSVTAKWVSNSETVKVSDSIGSNATEEIQITIVTKELTEEMLPSSSLNVPITFTLNLAEKTN